MMTRHVRAAGLIFGAILMASEIFAPTLLAQREGATPTPGSSEGQSKPEEQRKENKQTTGQAQSRAGGENQSTNNDRIFYALPNYMTVENAGQAPPLTARKKFKLVAKGSFDYTEYPFVGIKTIISQATNSQPSFGQGLRGFGKRYAINFTDNTVGNFMANAAVPSLLREDPRYYQLGKGRFSRRAGYALSRLLVTKTDSGGSQFNCGEIGGNALAAVISNAYHPPEDRKFSKNVRIWLSQVAWDGVGNELKEFWPDLRRKYRKHRTPRAVTRAGRSG
jgi:hypothetical protein